MKIISGGIQHETNTFAKGSTTAQDFIRDTHLGEELPAGAAIFEHFIGTGTFMTVILRAAMKPGLN